MIKELNNKMHQKVNILPQVIAITTFLTDILTLYYINNYWLKFKLDDLVRLSFAAQGHHNVPSHTLNQAAGLLGNSLGTMFFFFLVWHMVIYILLFFKKKWAINYVYRYVFFTVLLTVIELAILVKDFNRWIALLALITISYLFTYLGLKVVRKSQEQ